MVGSSPKAPCLMRSLLPPPLEGKLRECSAKHILTFHLSPNLGSKWVRILLQPMEHHWTNKNLSTMLTKLHKQPQPLCQKLSLWFLSHFHPQIYLTLKKEPAVHLMRQSYKTWLYPVFCEKDKRNPAHQTKQALPIHTGSCNSPLKKQQRPSVRISCYCVHFAMEILIVLGQLKLLSYSG